MLEVENIESSNGLILKTHYIPEELLIQILSYVDCVQLVLCQLVCKKWNKLIKHNVWRKKAESACGQLLLIDDKIHWSTYFSICYKKPFTRNLLMSNDVKVSYDGNNFKTIQLNAKDKNPPINILPYPDDLLLDENISCISIIHDSIVSVQRKFVIDLIKEGFTEYMLDNWQPVIEISEWYCAAQEEEKAEYKCSIKLLNGSDAQSCNRVMGVYHFDKKMNNADKRGKWFKFTHVFKNYGTGLRKIQFYTGGHNNIIMAGASVIMTVPSRKNFHA